MKKLASILFFSLFFSFFLVNSVEARSGCCSHHGGVCGCGCCDSTSLSATCAPYYPECNSNPEPEPVIPVSVPVQSVPVTISSVNQMDSVEVNSVSQSQIEVAPALATSSPVKIENVPAPKITPTVAPKSANTGTIGRIQNKPNVANNANASATPNISASATPIVNQEKKEESNHSSDSNGSGLGTVIMLGIAGFIVYSVKKKKRK
jgi:hypothetical protein